ncbi:MAG: 4Fe-4S binding protein [Bacteroides sp.]|nr:4Fe-4S binding protein [Ruminococcus flavefaciens]MCM1555205.1 4Fe-4S binding protein [Bacteroides sp.]
MLRKIRITLAALFFALITLLFLDFTGTLHAWFGWLAKIQFLPAVLALNVGVVVALVLLTLLFGRVYCSVICPLGVFQDIVSWISGKRKKHRFRFSYSPAKKWLRYTVLVLFVIALVAGIGSFVALLAPYSSYGRIAQNLFAPLWQWGNNFLAYLAERADSYAFYRTDVWIKSLPTFIVAAVTFVVLVVLAWRNGRTYCNTICPVGTVLGFLSKFALFQPVINKNKCNACGLCSRKCKAACIDGKNHLIDYSRCVACMDCIDTCQHGAIQYRLRYGKKNTPVQAENKQEVDTARRGFLTGAGLLLGATALKAQDKTVDGGLATILDKKIPERQTPIVPPGAQSLEHLRQHCTGCQLCVSACPNGVLRPSSSLMSLMQPESSYERGYCRPECTKCSEVCPAGAILKIDPAQKSSIQIGHAVWVRQNCLPIEKGVTCGNCARHCPTGAITMVPSDPEDEYSVKIPAVNEERCIGCGACENLCPARPFSAIYVEGHEVHKTI